MSLISTDEYQLRKNKLYAAYGNMLSLSYEISTPYGWLSAVEEMFITLEMSLKPESLEKIRFLDIKSKYASARFQFGITEDIDERDRKRAYDIVNMYEELASEKCEVCGAPGKELVLGGYYIRRCPEHFDVF